MFRLIKLKNGNNRCEKQERFSNRQHQRYQASNSFVDLPFPGMAEEELKVTSSVLHRVHEASLKVNLTILDYMENHYTNYRLMRGRFFRYGDVFISPIFGFVLNQAISLFNAGTIKVRHTVAGV